MFHNKYVRRARTKPDARGGAVAYTDKNLRLGEKQTAGVSENNLGGVANSAPKAGRSGLTNANTEQKEKLKTEKEACAHTNASETSTNRKIKTT